jgi:hypothetical protein
MAEITIQKGPGCAGCGNGEQDEPGALFIWDQLGGRSEWWHLRCIPPSLRVPLEVRGWEFPGSAWE